jgi:hypothetical protein
MLFTHTFSSIDPILSESSIENLETLFYSNYQLILKYFDYNIHFIKIEYHSEDSNFFASFDIIQSSETTHYFHLYPRLIKLINQDLKRLESIILHEIIHGLDHSILNKQFLLTQVESISTQHLFIHYLATIRNDGVAILVQKLLHQEPIDEIVRASFLNLENDLNSLLNLSITQAVYNRISFNELKHILQQLHIKLYNYAHVIAFTLSKKQLHLLQYNELNEFIFQSSHEDKSKLINYLLSMDVSEWIQQLISIEKENVIRLDIKLELLVHLCSLMNPKIYKKHYTILDDIPRYAYQKKTEKVISILEQVVSEKYDINEIRRYLKKSNVFHDDLDFEIADLCQKLLQFRNEKTRDIIDLALSYYISKKDIINDETLFLGKQDDWIVLDSIYTLLNLTFHEDLNFNK